MKTSKRDYFEHKCRRGAHWSGRVLCDNLFKEYDPECCTAVLETKAVQAAGPGFTTYSLQAPSK